MRQAALVAAGRFTVVAIVVAAAFEIAVVVVGAAFAGIAAAATIFEFTIVSKPPAGRRCRLGLGCLN